MFIDFEAYLISFQSIHILGAIGSGTLVVTTPLVSGQGVPDAFLWNYPAVRYLVPLRSTKYRPR